MMRADGVDEINQSHSADQENAVIGKIEGLLESSLASENLADLESILDELIDNLLRLDYGYRVNIFGRAYSFNGRRIVLPNHIHQMVTLYDRWKTSLHQEDKFESLKETRDRVLLIGAKAYFSRNQVNLWLGRSARLNRIYREFCLISFDFCVAKLKAGVTNVLDSFPASFRESPEFMHLIITKEPLALMLVPPALQGDRRLVQAAVRRHGWALKYASPELKADQALVEIAVSKDSGALRFADAALKATQAVVEIAVRKDGETLQLAAPALKATRAVVEIAVRQNGWALQYASPELRADRDLVKIAVRDCGGALKYASPELQADRDLVEIAVRQNGWALEYAPPELKADQVLVEIAVRQKGGALQYASPELRATRAVVKIAVAQNGSALEFASLELQADQEVVKIAVAKNGSALEHASPKLQADQDLVEKAVGNCCWLGLALKFASPELRANRAVVEIAVTQNERALEYASPELKADQALVKIAVRKSADALKYASRELQGDRSLLRLALSNGRVSFLPKLSIDLAQYPEILILAVAECDSWKEISDWFAADKNKPIKAHVAQVPGRWNTPYSSFLLFLYGLSSAYDDEKHAEKASAVRLIKLRKIGKYHQLGVLSLIATFAGVRMESEFVEEGQCALIERRSDWSVVNAAANKLGWQSLLEQKSAAEPAQANQAAAEAKDQSALSVRAHACVN